MGETMKYEPPIKASGVVVVKLKALLAATTIPVWLKKSYT